MSAAHKTFSIAVLIVSLVVGCGKSDPAENNRSANGSETTQTLAQPNSDSTPGDPKSPTSESRIINDEDDQHGAAKSQSLSREQKLDQADEFLEAGKIKEAAKILTSLLLIDSADAPVAFRLANIRASGGQLAEAVELLDGIPIDHEEAGLPALGQSADWCMQLGQFDKAESKYREILKLIPDAAPAHRQLAYMLNRQGRRHEAAIHIRELCKLGNVRQDELHALIILSDAMYDAPGSEVGENENPYFPIGDTAEARRLFNQREYAKAVEILVDEFNAGKLPQSMIAFFGRAAAEAQDEKAFKNWIAQTNEQTRQHSEYWAAIGTYLLNERRFDEAARAFAEAIDRDFTDLISIGRLHATLKSLGKDELAIQINQHWESIREILRVNNKIPDDGSTRADLIADLAGRLYDFDRQLEAVMWKSIEGSLRGVPREAHKQLNEQRISLVRANSGFPNSEKRIGGLIISDYPLPNLESLKSQSIALGDGRESQLKVSDAAPKFENIADKVGLTHVFRVAPEPQASGFAIYQVIGGATVVLDFDLDGNPDLYLGQGAAAPPSFKSASADSLYRQADEQLQQVSEHARFEIKQFTTGVTSGDWNQDGFPDLVVSGVGDDYLLINNGDGTFRTQFLTTDDTLIRTSSSVALADLNGDALPDIFEVAYVEDKRMAVKPERDENGEVIKAVNPIDFSPGSDRQLLNDGSGTALASQWDLNQQKSANGLGVVITNFDDITGNEIFIGNDQSANQFWVRDRETGSWSESALVRGCGFSFTGRETAAMGIAMGDFDQNGAPDLHITNYQQEAANLFLQSAGAFRDRNLQFGLNGPSRSVLGFGSQGIDVENDGHLDLAVTNGHVDDEAASTEPFLQPAQLFRNSNQSFQLVDVTDPSGYWGSPHLGRAMATLDFNRDGKMDLLISHIEEPTALLLNQTDSDLHWIQIQLVGTTSERDAIGAKVQLQFGDQTLHHWISAGDGYLAKNEAITAFGLGDTVEISKLTITWPNGNEQSWSKLKSDRRYQLVEGSSEAYRLD